MNDNWKQNPKIKTMDPEKLKFLEEFAKKADLAPKNQLLASFMTLTMEANAKGIQFSDQETDLLVSILTTDMSPEDRKKLDTLKMISKKLSAKNK